MISAGKEGAKCHRSWGRCEVTATTLHLFVTIPRPRPVDDAAAMMRVVRRLCHSRPSYPQPDQWFDEAGNSYHYTYPNVEQSLDLSDRD